MTEVCDHDWVYRDLRSEEGCYLTRECVFCQQVERRVWVTEVIGFDPIPSGEFDAWWAGRAS